MDPLIDSKTSLRDVFMAYVGRSEGLESRAWVKLLKETKVIDRSFTTTDGKIQVKRSI